ncbi:unnamed protein product [Closterium sp. NIES-65]|nr:unnamed protein product [Closterium sp. NIES-65]
MLASGEGGDPHLSIPHLSIPHLSIPHLSIPHLSIPHLSIPHLSIPHLSIPHLSIPHLSIPHLSIPHLSIPHLSIPHLSIPHLSIPHLSIPHLSIPHLSIPHLSIPHLSIPHLSIPHLSIPHLLIATRDGKNRRHPEGRSTWRHPFTISNPRLYAAQNRFLMAGCSVESDSVGSLFMYWRGRGGRQGRVQLWALLVLLHFCVGSASAPSLLCGQPLHVLMGAATANPAPWPGAAGRGTVWAASSCTGGGGEGRRGEVLVSPNCTELHQPCCTAGCSVESDCVGSLFMHWRGGGEGWRGAGGVRWGRMGG